MDSSCIDMPNSTVIISHHILNPRVLCDDTVFIASEVRITERSSDADTLPNDSRNPSRDRHTADLSERSGIGTGELGIQGWQSHGAEQGQRRRRRPEDRSELDEAVDTVDHAQGKREHQDPADCDGWRESEEAEPGDVAAQGAGHWPRDLFRGPDEGLGQVQLQFRTFSVQEIMACPLLGPAADIRVPHRATKTCLSS